jgi:hypothetical protein
MKKIIISWLFCLTAVYIFGQDVCLYFREKKIQYKVSETKILVKSKENDVNDIKKTLQKTIVGNLKKIDDLGSGLFSIETENIWDQEKWLTRNATAYEKQSNH